MYWKHCSRGLVYGYLLFVCKSTEHACQGTARLTNHTQCSEVKGCSWFWIVFTRTHTQHTHCTNELTENRLDWKQGSSPVRDYHENAAQRRSRSEKLNSVSAVRCSSKDGCYELGTHCTVVNMTCISKQICREIACVCVWFFLPDRWNKILFSFQWQGQ